MTDTPTPPDMPELLPCPFCGGPAVMTMKPDTIIQCGAPWNKCALRQKFSVEEWNTRPTPPADAMMSEHRDAIAELIKIAARMATGEWLPSPFQKDHKRKVPRWILGVFDKLQRDACYNAQKIKRSVDVLRRALQPPALDKGE